MGNENSSTTVNGHPMKIAKLTQNPSLVHPSVYPDTEHYLQPSVKHKVFEDSKETHHHHHHHHNRHHHHRHRHHHHHHKRDRNDHASQTTPSLMLYTAPVLLRENTSSDSLNKLFAASISPQKSLSSTVDKQQSLSPRSNIAAN